MFLKDISTIICTILADEKNITVQQLYEKVTRRKVAVSLPNFYKIIARMLDEQVLVKKNNLLQLHGMRVQYAMMITDKIKLNYLQENNLNVEKLKSGQSQIFEAPSIYELDIIWTDFLGQLYSKYIGDMGYYYNSHPYHMLGMPEKEKTNLEELGPKLAKTYFLFGNTTFLDHYGAQLLSMQGYEIKCVDDTLFPKEGYCLNIFGDYLIEAIFPDIITEYFKIYFDSVTCAEEFNAEMFTNIIRMKAGCSLKLIHSPEHAEKMKKKIRKCFD